MLHLSGPVQFKPVLFKGPLFFFLNTILLYAGGQDFPGKSTGVGCHFLLQRIFPTLGLNLGLPHCRQMLYHLSHQGSPS